MTPADLERPLGGDPRLFRFRAGRALLLGVFAMGVVAWIVSAPAVLVAAAAGGGTALLTSRAARVRTLVIATLAAALAGAFTGSLLFSRGSPALRLTAAAIASLAAAPWSVVLGFVLRARSYARSAEPPP